MKNIRKRLKVCYYALTKKDFFFCGISDRQLTKSKPIAIVKNDNDSNQMFLTAVKHLVTNIINKRNEKNN